MSNLTIMDKIYRLKESIFEYLAPRKRQHTIESSAPFASIQRPFQSNSLPKSKEKAVRAGRVNKKRLSPSDSKRVGARRRKRFEPNDSYDEAEDEIEVSTEVSRCEILPSDSVSQLGVNEDTEMMETVEEEDEEEGGGEDDEEEGGDLISEDESEVGMEDKVEKFLDYQTEYEQRKKALEEISIGDWAEEEIALFRKLSMRGFEPLMHSSWHDDFTTCPAVIFTDNSSEIIIGARSLADNAQFLGTRALVTLSNIGYQIRAKVERKIPQEPFINREIQRYIKWSERDGGYAHLRFLPVICMVAGRPNQELDKLTNNTNDQLKFLAKRHRDYLALPPPGRVNQRTGAVEMFRRKPPIIYGIIIAHWITIFVTLDSSNPEAHVKTVAHFDFSIREMDLWNAFAIAILVQTARDYTMNFTDEMEPEEVKEEIDPDL